MQKVDNGTLLLVLPGGAGRETTLRRIIEEVCPVTVLVPSALVARSSWARQLASAFIEFQENGFPTWAEAAWSAIAAHMDSTKQVFLGCTTWDEWGLEICAYLCDTQRLALPYTPLDTVLKVRNKIGFRQMCLEAGVPTIRFASVMDKDDLKRELQSNPWCFPLLIKPAKGAGSYYCRKVDSSEELLGVFQELDRALKTEGKTPSGDVEAGWSLEDFFEGEEVDVDGWARNGTVEWMMVSDNKPPLNGTCETGGMYPSQLPSHLVSRLEDLTRSVVGACHGIHSAFHFEALVNRETGVVMPIELNLRVGGAECPCCVEAVSGIYLPTAAADLALRRETRKPLPRRAAVAASTNEHHSRPGTIIACEGSQDFHEDPDLLDAAFFGVKGEPYYPTGSSASCLCWIAVGGVDAKAAEDNLRRCIDKCNLEVA